MTGDKLAWKKQTKTDITGKLIGPETYYLCLNGSIAAVVQSCALGYFCYSAGIAMVHFNTAKEPVESLEAAKNQCVKLLREGISKVGRKK